VGCGYRPRTGTIFFTRNGRKLEDVAHGLKNQNFFPSVGANGPCHVHVNFGQSGFVFIEANVKKWGLAPMTGSLAPPPPYGSEQGSILLETGGQENAQAQQNRHTSHGRHNSRFRPVIGGPTSPGPVRSPTDISLAQLVHVPSEEDIGEGTSGAGGHSPGLTAGSAHSQTQFQGLGVQYFPDRRSSLPPQIPPPPRGPEAPPAAYTQAPPPDYESPATSPMQGHDSADPAPGTGGESPQVPSYESAMAETRERISEAVSEGGDDDIASDSASESGSGDNEDGTILHGADRAPLLPRHEVED
jgi:SPRY domain